MMRSLDSILNMVDSELDRIAESKKFRSREDLENVYKLIDIAKDVYCIWKYEGEEDGMSFAGGMSYYDGHDGMTDERSYARGRGRNARRDSMGRYSRDGMRRYNYSYDDAKHEYAEDLRELMEKAPDEQTRMKIKHMIDQMDA